MIASTPAAKSIETISTDGVPPLGSSTPAAPTRPRVRGIRLSSDSDPRLLTADHETGKRRLADGRAHPLALIENHTPVCEEPTPVNLFRIEQEGLAIRNDDF